MKITLNKQLFKFLLGWLLVIELIIGEINE